MKSIIANTGEAVKVGMHIFYTLDGKVRPENACFKKEVGTNIWDWVLVPTCWESFGAFGSA